MAERRMFSKKIVRSSRFLKMPVSSRELYWQLGIEADDDGIVEAFTVMRTIGATEDDLKVLVSKQFVQVLNEDLVTYILDWNENNKLRADRKVDSIYKDLLIQVNPDIKLLESKPRADRKNSGTTMGRPRDGIGEDSIVKNNIVEEKENIKEKEDKTTKYFEEDNLNSIFIEFLEVRKKLKAVNSPRAIKTLINKLNKYPNDVKYQMIENSIVNSWKDVYELKTTKQFNKTTRKEVVPSWFNEQQQREEATPEEVKELEDAFAEFKDDWRKEAQRLQQELNEKY